MEATVAPLAPVEEHPALSAQDHGGSPFSEASDVRGGSVAQDADWELIHPATVKERRREIGRQPLGILRP